VRIERGAKRVRAYLGGEVVADTTEPVLVWEAPYYPTYYFPVADVRAAVIKALEFACRCAGCDYRCVSPRQALTIVLRPEHLRRTGAIALVVGTILLVINHSDTIISGEATSSTWVKVALTYCVPFVVSNLGLLAGKRAELRSDELEPSQATEEAEREADRGLSLARSRGTTAGQ
jgi:hypothetical protein